MGSQAAALESVMLGGAKLILGCSSKTCNEAVRGDMGLDTLQGRRDKNKLKWWYKLAALPGKRYPKKLFNQDWNFMPWRGRQRKCWSLMISFCLDKAEQLHDIQNGDCSMKGVGDSINEREIRKFEEGLNSIRNLTRW